MPSEFKDHFSSHANQYARSRPTYPHELFDYLVSLTSHHDLAWDCATGSGQAAVTLAGHFAQVVAADASAAQIANAAAHPSVAYLVTTAENSGLSNESVDLITVAQVLHWFDFSAFFNEADRVLKKGGVLAAWAYEMFHISPALDDIIAELYSVTLRDYWPPERRHVENGYADIPFPYPLLSTPAFEINVQ